MEFIIILVVFLGFLCLIPLHVRSYINTSRARSPGENDMDSFAADTVHHAKSFAAAAQRIHTVRLCSATPVIIEITEVAYLVSLRLSFTVSNVHTAPVHDLLNAQNILDHSARCLPLFVDTHFLGARGRLPQSKWKETHDLLNQQCCSALYLTLFGEEKNYFLDKLSSYTLTASAYPCGDLTISCDFLNLKGRTYRRDFAALAQLLRAEYPDASIRETEDKIFLAF